MEHDDPVAEELDAVFAAILAEEPPSSVTAESILREVHHGRADGNRAARRNLGRWFVTGPPSLKWAGGLVAAAAVIGAAVVSVPMMSGGSTDSAASAMAVQDLGAAGSAQSLMSQENAAGSAAASSGEEPSAEAYSALADGSESGDSAAAAAGADDSASSARAADCVIGPLGAEEWAAAVAGVPPELSSEPWATGSCAEGALRASGLTIRDSAGHDQQYLRVIVSAAPIGGDGAGSDALVVSATHGDVTVTVIANGTTLLDDAGLQRIAEAVAAAAP